MSPVLFLVWGSGCAGDGEGGRRVTSRVRPDYLRPINTCRDIFNKNDFVIAPEPYKIANVFENS